MPCLGRTSQVFSVYSFYPEEKGVSPKVILPVPSKGSSFLKVNESHAGGSMRFLCGSPFHYQGGLQSLIASSYRSPANSLTS